MTRTDRRPAGSMRTPDRERGFTLIEVLTAFAILTLSLTAILQSFSQSSRTSFTAQRYAEATALAENVLAVAAAQSPIALGTDNGGRDDGYRWRIDVAPYRPAGEMEEAVRPELFQLVRFSVEVRFDEGVGTPGRSVRLSTLRLAPTADRQ